MLRKVNRSRSGKACQVIVRTWDFTLTLESFGHLGQKSDVIWNICKKKKNTLDDTLEKDLQGKDGSRKICKKAITIIQVRNNSNLDKGQL